MKTGNVVKLKMKKVLRIGMAQDETLYEGKLQWYDEKEERIYLVLQDENLMNISLDAIYQCEILSESNRFICDGRVEERYCSSNGKTVKIRIKNGFSKINLK